MILIMMLGHSLPLDSVATLYMITIKMKMVVVMFPPQDCTLRDDGDNVTLSACLGVQ